MSSIRWTYTALVAACASLVACASRAPEPRLLTREELLACEDAKAELSAEEKRLWRRQRNLATLQAKLQEANRQLWTQSGQRPSAASEASGEFMATVATLNAAIDESNADGAALKADVRAHEQRIAAYNASCGGTRYWSSDAGWVDRRIQARRAAHAASSASAASLDSVR
jgi:deoxyribodipyrimidine photolyase